MSLKDASRTSTVRLRLRTALSDCLVLVAAGRTDYLLMLLETGRLKVGPTLVTVILWLEMVRRDDWLVTWYERHRERESERERERERERELVNGENLTAGIRSVLHSLKLGLRGIENEEKRYSCQQRENSTLRISNLHTKLGTTQKFFMG